MFHVVSAAVRIQKGFADWRRTQPLHYDFFLFVNFRDCDSRTPPP